MPNSWPHASGVLEGLMAGLRMGHLGRTGLLYRTALEGATFSLSGGCTTRCARWSTACPTCVTTASAKSASSAACLCCRRQTDRI